MEVLLFLAVLPFALYGLGIAIALLVGLIAIIASIFIK